MNRLLTTFLLLLIASSPVVRGDIDPVKVKAAIDGAVRYLKTNENRWESGSHPGGRTSLCLLALVSAGVPKDDPVIVRGLEKLRAVPLTATYVVALQTMVYSIIDPQRDALRIQENVAWLAKAQCDGGGWSYTEARGGSGDNSNAQFAVLALYEAERAGIAAPPAVWAKARDYWERGQNDSGAWGYTPADSGSSGVRASMVCAGLGSLLMTSGQTARGGAHVEGEQIICGTSRNDQTQERIRRGLQWLARNFSVDTNPPYGDTYYFYYMYGLERVGRLTGHRFLTTNARDGAARSYDWYREGTDKLLSRRERSLKDHWENSGEDDILATSFALLFLAKGRWPVLLSKLEYGSDDAWNVHPNDIAHLTRFAEMRWKLDLTWQTMRLDIASVEELLQSPVLYLCGDKTPIPRDAAEARRLAAKLRDYLDQGGFIFAEAQSNNASFDEGVRAFIKLIFENDGDDYELRPLPPEHPIWTAELPLPPGEFRPLEGVEFGCRTCVVYAPPCEDDAGKKRPSMSCLWEVARFYQRGQAPYPPSVLAKIDGGLTLGINVLAYATNRELKTKDEKLATTLAARLTDAESRRGRIYLGLLDHGGGLQVAPRAFPNLLQWVSSKMGVSVDVRVDAMAADDPNLSRYPVVLMHGRAAFTLTESQRKGLREHIERGGTLIAASICSTAAFTDAFRREMKLVFPDKELAAILPADPLFSQEYGGYKIDKLMLRVSQQSPGRSLQTVERETIPELQGIAFDGRYGIIFSPYDISCALERGASLDCRGYTQDSALRLAVNILLYAIEGP